MERLEETIKYIDLIYKELLIISKKLEDKGIKGIGFSCMHSRETVCISCSLSHISGLVNEEMIDKKERLNK